MIAKIRPVSARMRYSEKKWPMNRFAAVLSRTIAPATAAAYVNDRLVRYETSSGRKASARPTLANARRTISCATGHVSGS